MKKVLLTILVVFIGLPMFAQEVRFPSAIVSAGGGSNGSSVNLSRWRLGQVHVVTLSEDVKIKDKSKEDLLTLDWNVTVYPNPVEDLLYLEFELPESKDLFLRITDVVGRVIFIQEARIFINGSHVELNMSNYLPASYLLQITSSDLLSQKVYCIQKL
ncbi:MAG: T9SS type A sorting domain-containing protein [Bacteroidales bacterium]